MESSELYQLRLLEKRLDLINKASDILTVKEKRQLLYPGKTDAETEADLQALAGQTKRGISSEQ